MKGREMPQSGHRSAPFSGGSAQAGVEGVGWDPNPFLGELGAPRPPDHGEVLRGKQALAAGAADGEEGNEDAQACAFYITGDISNT